MKEQLETLVEGLAHARLRPSMYYISNEFPAAQSFMHGFSLACAILGVDAGKEEDELWRERFGLRMGNHHPVNILREQGLSDDEISAELLTVLILALKRKYDISSEPVLKVHSKMRETIAKLQSDLENPTENNIYHKSEGAAKAARKRVEYTLRAMDSLEKEMDSR